MRQRGGAGLRMLEPALWLALWFRGCVRPLTFLGDGRSGMTPSRGERQSRRRWVTVGLCLLCGSGKYPVGSVPRYTISRRKSKVCAAGDKGVCYEVNGNYGRIRARRRRRYFANFRHLKHGLLSPRRGLVAKKLYQGAGFERRHALPPRLS